MAKEFSPEERLLHLIKGKNNTPKPDEVKTEKPEGAYVAESRREDIPDTGLAAEKSSSERPADKTPKAADAAQPAQENNGIPKGLKRGINLNYAILGVFIMVIVLAGYAVFSGLLSKEDKEVEDIKLLIESLSKEETPEKPKPEEAPKPEEDVPRSRKTAGSFDEYQKLLDKKAIFAPPAGSGTSRKSQDSAEIRDMAKGLTLVGIIPGQEPQVIIEDRKNDQTLFLKEGEAVDLLTVKDISSGKVILEYNGETVTLSL